MIGDSFNSKIPICINIHRVCIIVLYALWVIVLYVLSTHIVRNWCQLNDRFVDVFYFVGCGCIVVIIVICINKDF